MLLFNLSQEAGVWKDPVLDKILNDQIQDPYHAEGFFFSEGPFLLEMRIKQLLKVSKVAAATSLAKLCSDHPEMSKKGHFKQLYLTCLCAASPNIRLIEEIAKVDCKDALEMICNLESEGDEKTSLILCAAFLSRQLQFGEMYCAWELTLFWSKLQRRVDSSIQVYLEICRQLSQLTKTVYHIFFLIKVIQSETEAAGLPTCIELCVRALRLESSENAKVKISICKTISCLLPDDLEVKRACQLTEFLLEPTVDAYYAVEMLYNQPDQKYDEESLPVPNSLRCELLLVLKTRWPFDPEFWDWKTLKRQCLALMGEEASIVSSIDELNDNEAYDHVDDYHELTKDTTINGLDCFNTTSVKDVCGEKQKKKPIKKIKEQGCISARFRNWQAYMQYCVLCDKEFLGHRIIRHAQKHCTDGIYSCPICAKQYTTKETFVPHVTLHVKQSCKERLETMGPLRKHQRLPKKAQASKSKKSITVTKQERQVKKNTLYSDDFIVFNDNDNSDENDDKDNQTENIREEKPALVNEFPCPVIFCNKGFKYFKNLIAHVRGHKDSEEAARFLEIQSKKVVCQYCRRQFVSLTHLNDHLQMHCGSQPYICIQMKCKASFKTYADLLSHKKAHRDFRAKCMFPKCGRIFTAAYMLFDHEAQHYNTFTCKIPGCGKIFRSQLQLEQHLCEHSSSSLKSQPIKTEDVTEMTNTVAGGETSLPECTVSSQFSSEPFHSADVPISSMAKDPSLTETLLLEKKVDPDSSGGVDNSMHLLDQLLPPPTDVLSSANLLTQVLPTPSGSQAVLPKTDLLDNTTFTADAINLKLPSLTEGFHDLLNQNKLIGTGETLNANKTQIRAQPGFEEQCLTVFQHDKHSGQGYPNKDQIVSMAPSEIKIEAEQQIRSVMPFNTTGPLCENNLVMPVYEEGAKSENLLSLSLETSNALSDVLPPASDVTLPPVRPAPIERFKCNVEGCTRIYNSVQSIGKHMKSAHPDHYDSFKMERKNRKKQKPGSMPPSADEKPTYCILPGSDIPNNSVFQTQLQSAAHPSFCNQLQHLPNPVFPTHLENLVNPLLSSVETAISQGLSKNVAETLLGPEVGNLSNAALTSQIEDLANVLPMKFENGSDPFLPMPTENDPLPVMSSLSGSTVFSQLGGNSDHVLAGGAATNSVFLKEEVESDTSFSKRVDSTDMDATFNLDKSSSMLSNSGDKKNSSRRTTRNKERTKHSARAKCPAIIRDGKFICSRCYRVFTNPRSLGGHLSKRTVCKPHNDYDISTVVPQIDGQPSVLASMILSSTPKKKAKSPLQAFSPNMTIKEEPLLPPVQPEHESNQYLQSHISHPSISTLTPQVERSIEQKIEAPHNIDNRQLNPNRSLNECIPSSPQISPPKTLNTTPTKTLETITDLKDGYSLGNLDLTTCTNIADHPEGKALKTENGFCAKSVINSVGENNCLPKPASSTRVSVISGPQSSTTKKKSSASKRKKKTDKPAAVEASHELAKNLLAAVGGNLQMSTELQPSFMTYGSDLLENLAKHFSSADKELFMSCINESLKASSEAHALCPLPIKAEKSEAQLLPPNTPDRRETEKLDLHPDFRERSFNNMISDTSEAYSFNANVQNVFSALPQSHSTINSSMVDNLPTVLHNKQATTACSPSDKMNIPVCSVSPTQETSAKYDEQVSEIIDLVQKLQLLDNIMPECLVAEVKCPLSENPPIMSSVIVPNPGVNLMSEETPAVSPTLVDKCNGKPFICQEEACTYCAMTKDALFKHYTKVHYYTTEKLGEIKKHQLKFAPFRCVVPTCTKTFTRNSNLRAHCQAMHHFTSEQMVKLKIKRPYGRKPAGESVDFSAPEIPGSPEAKKFMDSHDPLQEIKSEPEICQDVPLMNTMVHPKLHKSKPSLHFPYQESLLTFNQKSKKGPKIRKKRKEKELKRKKSIQKDGKSTQGLTSYKPYQCVHQGCTAAFTIQQNLILHYQSIHKSEASKFSSEDDRKEEQDEGSNDLILNEFRCTESDCSRIFSSLSSLIQHYVKLHEMIAEEIENVVSFVNGGSFKCDQTQCTASFTTCTGYIVHLEEIHNLKLKRVKLEGEEMYKCDIEGCDRIYATRSNLLRHIFRKHKDKHKEHLIRPRKISVSDQDNADEKTPKEKSRVPKTKYESEGGEVSKTKRCKGSNGEKSIKSGIIKTKPELTTLKYGRHTYSLKAKDAALAECTDLHAKQYPCMVRGCKSVVTSEHSIIRHYKCHKLSRAFILKHRNTLILCKRRGRTKVKEVSLSLNTESAVEHTKSEVKEVPSEATDPQQIPPSSTLLESSDESTVSTTQQNENEKNEMDELTELFISKLSNEDSTSSESQVRSTSLESCDFQETSSCQSEPQRIVSVFKRSNKQKQATPNRKRKIEIPDETLSAETSSTLSCEETLLAVSSPEDTPAFDLSSFKPMGFEVSFLKFLEESAVKEKKTVERVHFKPDTEAELMLSEKRPRLSVDEDFDTDIYLLFSNPSHLPNMDNVRIVLDEAFNDYIELVVKQLNELNPVVVLKRDIYCSEFASIAKEQNIDLDEEASV